MKPLVTVDWLNANSDHEQLVILDASTKSVLSSGETVDMFIPNARIMDLKHGFSKVAADFPNTVPSPSEFQESARKMGINDDSRIVIYDQTNIFSSPRARWLFKAMGHDRVAVLDGGLPAWIASGFPTVSESITPSVLGNFIPKLREEYVWLENDIKENIAAKTHTVVDARSPGRFKGTKPEPREGISSGHIPNSVNLPFQNVLRDGKMKSTGELDEIFDDLVPSEGNVVFSCGSGLTACIIQLAAEISGRNLNAVYDGSWTEWATLNPSKIEKDN